MRLRNLIRAAWILYASSLLVATHWPGLAVPPGPFSRMDLIVHASVFMLWTLLFYNARWLARRLGILRRTIAVGVLWACFDETTQPIFRRTFDLLDLSADITGVLLACGLILLARSMMPAGPIGRSEQP